MSKLIIDKSGDRTWYDQNGLYHRVDGPAVIMVDGTKIWCHHGDRHRLDGPAYDGSNGDQAWFLNGQLHRADGPAVVRSNGTKEWYQNGVRHRVGGPAVIGVDGTQEWWNNNQRHRLDGPATINQDNTYEWWVNGKKLNSRTMNILTQNLTHIDAMCCYLTYLKLPSTKIKKITGWDPTTTPTKQQLDTWRMMAGLTQ